MAEKSLVEAVRENRKRPVPDVDPISTTTVTVTARQIDILIAGICALEDRGTGYGQDEINKLRTQLFRELPRQSR